jgi:hypothetical protein
LSKLALDWYTVEIELPYGELGPHMDWCRRNCTKEWRVSLDNNRFFFESEKDYINFLIWKK